MKKIAIILSLVLIFSVFVTGCGGSKDVAPQKKESASSASTGKEKKSDDKKTEDEKIYVLKGATNNPKSSGHYEGLLIFKELVEERTNGRVTVELYSDGVLGDEEQMVEGMKMGAVDVMMAAAAKYANFVPEMDLYSPPYTFKNWDHYKAVMSSDIEEKMAKAVKDSTGDIYLGLFTDGVRNVFTREEVKTLAALKGIKLRTMTGPNETNSFKALGTSPTPLAYTELYSALQAGVVDGAENTMTSILGMKFYESCKYVLKTGHNYLALPFFISSKAVEKLPEDLQEIVIQAGKDTCPKQIDKAIQLNKDNEKVLTEQYGVTINEFSEEDLLKAMELVKPVLDENAKRIGMESELEKIREIGKNY